jgi:SAM-dependent methyltransferase
MTAVLEDDNGGWRNASAVALEALRQPQSEFFRGSGYNGHRASSAGWTGETPLLQQEFCVDTKPMPETTPTPDERLQREFNRWAEAGGEKMERHHLDITGKTIRLMDLRPGDRVLDLGCGSGWATRLLARLVADGPEGFGQVVGVDVADEMIRQARAASKDFENILYVWGSAQQIPWEENFFDKILSVESCFY